VNEDVPGARLAKAITEKVGHTHVGDDHLQAPLDGSAHSLRRPQTNHLPLVLLQLLCQSQVALVHKMLHALLAVMTLASKEQ